MAFTMRFSQRAMFRAYTHSFNQSRMSRHACVDGLVMTRNNGRARQCQSEDHASYAEAGSSPGPRIAAGFRT